MADNDPIASGYATDRLVTLVHRLLHATIDHGADDALDIIRRYVDRALPGTTKDDLDAALGRIIAATEDAK
jgi:hypothetical protein